MAVHRSTITARAGPAKQATALILDNINSVNFDLGRKILTVVVDNNSREFDLGSVTSASFSISGGNYRLTIS